MNKNVSLIIAELLELASDEFSNNVCNDLSISDTPENRQFITDMQKWADPNEPIHISTHKGNIATYDWLVMDYCAYLLKESAK